MNLNLGEMVNRYQLRKHIASDGISESFLADDSTLLRSVVLKIGYPSSAGKHPLLLNEARVLAQLRHHSLLSIFDVGIHLGMFYIVHEYFDGGSLENILRQGRLQIPQKQIVEMFANLADTVDFVHRRGFLHRRIASSVIFQDNTGQLRLAGFEFAGQMSELIKVNKSRHLGIPRYLAPEEVRGSNSDLSPATDVWGIGWTLYQSLTGNLPFINDSVLDFFKALLHDDPPLPSSKNSSISSDLDRICLKCLSKNPKDRYADCGSLATELRNTI